MGNQVNELLKDYAAFESDCEDSGYTDTSRAWDMLYRMVALIRQLFPHEVVKLEQETKPEPEVKPRTQGTGSITVRSLEVDLSRHEKALGMMSADVIYNHALRCDGCTSLETSSWPVATEPATFGEAMANALRPQDKGKPEREHVLYKDEREEREAEPPAGAMYNASGAFVHSDGPSDTRDGTVGEVIDRRTQVYGDVEGCFADIAQMWTAYIGFPIQAHNVPIMQLLMKVVRSKTSPDYSDHSDDIEGYLDIFRTIIGPDMIQARTVAEYIAKKWPNG